MHKRLFIPGPTEVDPQVLMAQAKPMIGHRMAEYTELYFELGRIASDQKKTGLSSYYLGKYYLYEGRLKLAEVNLKKAVGDHAAEDLQAIEQSIQTDKNKSKAKLKDIFNPALKVVLTIGLVLAVLQQITGINSVFFYAPMIFEQSGIGTDASFTQAIYVGLTNLIFTIVAIGLIDKIGRKALLIIGVTGIALSMFVLAYGFHSATYTLTPSAIKELPAQLNKEALSSVSGVTYNNDVAFKKALQKSLGMKEAKQYEAEIITAATTLNARLILFGIMAFVASFAVSIGPVMWVLFSELFPNKLRAIAISFVGTINSVVSFSVQLVFPWELHTLGASSTFLIYGVFAAAGLIFILMKVPETKGKSLEELEKILIKKQ